MFCFRFPEKSPLGTFSPNLRILSYVARPRLTLHHGQPVSNCGRACGGSSPNVRAGVRRRGSADGGGVRPGTGEPDRGAHRLQRGLRPADGTSTPPHFGFPARNVVKRLILTFKAGKRKSLTRRRKPCAHARISATRDRSLLLVPHP